MTVEVQVSRGIVAIFVKLLCTHCKHCSHGHITCLLSKKCTFVCKLLQLNRQFLREERRPVTALPLCILSTQVKVSSLGGN